MRRISLVVVMVGAIVILSAGVATTAVKFGTDGQDFLMGTTNSDVLYGKGGIDFIEVAAATTSSRPPP